MAALVISGIVVGALFQLLAGQGRFVEMQSAREEVQQNTRAALELIGSELRTVASGAALVRATSDSITFRSPRLWGVVCAVTGPTTLDIAVPAIAAMSYSVNNGTGVVVNLGTAAAPLWSTAVGVTGIGSAAGSCNGVALAGGVERRSVTVAATPENGGTTPVIGNNLYLYDQVTYRTGTSSSVPGVWIQRRLGDASGGNQPMAGPVEGGGAGLSFAYFSDASAGPLPTPIADPTAREGVSRVMVVVQAISRNSIGNSQQSKADTVVISLRNRL